MDTQAAVPWLLVQVIFGLEDGEISSSRTSVHIRTKCRYIPEDCNIHVVLFSVFRIKIEKSSVSEYSFVVSQINFKLEQVRELNDLKLEEKKGMPFGSLVV